jgi:hypothetical protein
MKRSGPLKRYAAMTPSGKRMKSSKPKMTPARKAAKGQPCMVRLPGCDGGGETTVLAHYSLSGLSGAGLKSPDLIGAHCCHSCHAIADGRTPRPEGYTRNDVRLALAEGVLRTIAAMGEA